MTVIINDFELVPNTNPNRPRSGEEQPTAAEPQRLRPVDIEAVFRRQQRRSNRLRAH